MNGKEWEILYLPYFFESIMEFKIIDNLKFVNIDMDFLKKLHNASSEVFYQIKDYENKPYLGILLSNENYKYVIPLTSVKEKHLKWKIEEVDRFLIYDIVDKTQMVDGDFYKEKDKDKTYYHIWSAMDIKKMIPVIDSAISIVDINHIEKETEDTKKYKDLLNKELAFLVGMEDNSKDKYVIQKKNNSIDENISNTLINCLK